MPRRSRSQVGNAVILLFDLSLSISFFRCDVHLHLHVQKICIALLKSDWCHFSGIGVESEAESVKQACIWDAPITYELQVCEARLFCFSLIGIQVELMLTLQRLLEHFVAAALSLTHNRALDGVSSSLALSTNKNKTKWVLKKFV